MPSFIGQPLGSATQMLQDAGLRLGVTPAAPERLVDHAASCDSFSASIIVSQNPAAGEKVIVGAG